ncbi:MAG: cytochrome P450 [Elainellaceae cyanobacterium]
MTLPIAYPVVGHVPKWLFDRFGFLEACAASRARIVKLKFGKQVYLLNAADDIRHVLETDHESYSKTLRLNDSAGKQLFGDSVQVQYGAGHRQQRRQLQPVFMRQAIAGFAPQIASTVDSCLAHWRDGDVIDIVSSTLRLVHRVLGKMLFDRDFSQCDRALGEAIFLRRQQVNQQFSLRVPPLMLLMTGKQQRASRTLQWLERAMDSEIQARQQHPEQYSDLLSLLIQRQSTRDDSANKRLRDEALATSGGYETIAAVVIWTWYLLALHPHSEAKVVQEIAQVLGTRSPTAEDISNLTYTKLVIEESLRLYPPTWIFVRIAQQSDHLPSGTRLHRGDKLYLSPYLIHRHPDYFPSPHQFDPERFSDAGRRSRPKFSYFPFGGGPRVCIGQTLAEMTAILVFVAMVQRVRLTLLPHQRVAPSPQITLLPGRPLNMTIERLDSAR